MNANMVIPENLVVLHKTNLQIYVFHDFLNYYSIITAHFNKITVFYRDRMIENDHEYVLKGNKYIASIYSHF